MAQNLQKTIIILLILCSPAAAQVVAVGGNITPVNLGAHTPTQIWQGIVGDLILLGPNATNLTALANQINETDIVVLAPCAAPLINGTILLSNSSAAPVGLTSGNLTLLDSFIGRPQETGTETFPLTSTFTISGTPIPGVPTTNTYVNSAPQSIAFREGYLNDAALNLVFAIDVNLNTAGYNGTIFDYQAILPTQNGTATPYYITTDLNITCPAAAPTTRGGRGGRGYVNALILRVPELQAPEHIEVTEETVKQIEALKPLEIIAPKEVTATIGETLTFPITVINPNKETAPLITAALRIPSIVQRISDLHQNPLLYSTFGFSTLHGSTQTVIFEPLDVKLHEINANDELDIPISNDIPLTRPATLLGTLEVYAGNTPLAHAPITIHLIAPPIAVQTVRDGREVELTVLLNNEKKPARKTNLEINYNTGRQTRFADFFVLPLTQNTVELYGYTYKPAFAFEHTTARAAMGFAEE